MLYPELLRFEVLILLIDGAFDSTSRGIAGLSTIRMFYLSFTAKDYLRFAVDF